MTLILSGQRYSVIVRETEPHHPQVVGRRLTYYGPVNPVETLLGERPADAWVGLSFPERVAESLINVHARSKKRVLGILGRLAEDKSF